MVIIYNPFEFNIYIYKYRMIYVMIRDLWITVWYSRQEFIIKYLKKDRWEN